MAMTEIDRLTIAYKHAKTINDKERAAEIQAQIKKLEAKTETKIETNVTKQIFNEVRNCHKCDRARKEDRKDFFGNIYQVYKCPLLKEKEISTDITPAIMDIVKDWTGSKFYFVPLRIYKCIHFKGAGEFRTDCYVSVLKQYRENFPDAFFEIVTRQKFEDDGDSELSPSWNLLNSAKSNNWDFETYKLKFLNEIKNRPEARTRLEILKKQKALGKTIFLVCVEKDPRECHRSILKDILDEKISL